MTIINEFWPVVKTAQELATEHQLGWLVYAHNMPASVCGTATMVAGGVQANRDEAAAMASEVHPCAF